MGTPLQDSVRRVTDRIRERSAKSRAAYLAKVDRAIAQGPGRGMMACGNLAHAFAACSPADKGKLADARTPNLGIVTAYNDMLSAHQPYERYPDIIREAARSVGATAQVAGGVPAMCDGVTQGQDGMDLSLFSRDLIAMSSSIALSHNVYDCAVFLGVCDKIGSRSCDCGSNLWSLASSFYPGWSHDVRHFKLRKGPCATGLFQGADRA